MISRYLSVLAVVALAMGPATLWARTWKDSCGNNVIEAKFVRFARGTVFLQRGTKILQFSFDSQSKEDQDHVRTLVGKGRSRIRGAITAKPIRSFLATLRRRTRTR